MERKSTYMKIWHRLQAWALLRRARRQHVKLRRYIHHTAHEICGWKQEIHFLEEEAARHLEQAGQRRAEPTEETDKVVPIESATRPETALA